MRRYELTVEQFDGFAEGHGTAEAHRILVAAQTAKRMLLLRVLADAVPDGDLRRASRFDEALALFTRAQTARPAAAANVLAHPFLDAWASAAIRQPAERLPAFTAYAAAAASRAGLDFRIEVPAPDGQLTLPTIGTFHDLGAGPAVVRRQAGDLTVTGRNGTTGTDRAPGFAAQRRLHAGPAPHRIDVAVDDTDPHRDCFEWTPAGRLDDAAAERLRRVFADAWTLLVEHHRPYVAGIRTTLRSLVPIAAQPGGNAVSAASRSAFGSVALTVEESPAEMALLLVHECQHMTLGALLDLIDLYRDDGEPRHYAPWRADPRPVGALLQGTYAHLAVTDFWRVERRRTGGLTAELEFAYWLAQTLAGTASLLDSGELTDAGTRFVAGMARTLHHWQSEPVRPDVRAVADVMALAAGVQWRLRNLEPDPAGVERLGDAWRRGDDCPAVPASAVRSVPLPAAPARVPAVAERARRRLLGLAPPTDAEVDGWEADPWIDRAVAAGGGGLVQHPEVVRAVSATTGAEPADVARWITSGAARCRS